MNVSSRALLLVLMVLSQWFRTEAAKAQQDTDPPAVEAAIPDISGVWNSGPDLPGDQFWVRPAKSEGSFEISMNGGSAWAPIHWSAKDKQFEGKSEHYGKSTTAYELKLVDDQQSLRLKKRKWLGPGSFVSFEELVYLRASKEIPQFTQPKQEKTQAKADTESAAEIKVFTLANGDAAEYVKVLQGIFPDVTLRADARTNQIIAVFKKPETSPYLEALLLRLDETKTPKGPSRTNAESDPRRTQSPQELSAAIDAQEHRATTLAQKIREQGPKHPDSVKAREELNTALQAALDLKFQQEQLQLQQLEERLTRLQQQLTLRQAAASKIVERRARELLERHLDWTPDSPSSQQPDDLSNHASEVKPSQTWPLLTHTQVRFVEPKGQHWLVDHQPMAEQTSGHFNRSLQAIPTFYNFKRDRNDVNYYRVQLLPAADSEPTVAGVISIFPLDIPEQSLREFGSIPLDLTYEERRKIRLGNHLTIVYYIRRVDGKLWLETPVWTDNEPGIDPIAEARREGTVIAAIDFQSLPDRRRTPVGDVSEGKGVDPQTLGDARHAAWDPKIRVDVSSSSDLVLDPLAQLRLTGTLVGVAAVSFSEMPAQKGSVLRATVHDPLGLCRQEMREVTVSATRMEIEQALQHEGIKDIRWEEGPKTVGESATFDAAHVPTTKVNSAQPPPFPVIHVDVYSGSDRQQSAAAKDKLGFALQDLTGASVLIRDISEPKGDAVVAIVREWRGQAAETTKEEINAAFKNAGIQDVRWEERSKPASESPIPENHTQIHFKAPVGMRAAIDSSWDSMTFPGFTNFKRVEGIGRTYLHLFPNKATDAYPAAIDIYEADARVSAFLATNAVPIQVTDEDLGLMSKEKNITKIAYLPEDRFTQYADSKLEVLVSYRLDGNLDPFAEARRRGQIVAVFYLGPHAALETEEKDPAATWIWDNLRFKAKPVTDPALVPAPFRGGLQITEINGNGHTNQKGDILIGMGTWETLSVGDVIFAAEHQEERPGGPSGSVKPMWMYALRNGDLVVTRYSLKGRNLPKSQGVSPRSSMSLDQWIDILQRKQLSNESAGHSEAVRRMVDLANGATAKERRQVAMALFVKGETLDPMSNSEGPERQQIIELLRKVPDEVLLPLQIEILQGGGPARTLLAVHSLKKLRDYATSPEFPALVEQLWKLSGSEDLMLQISILDILADTLSLTNLKPEEFSTDERRKMVERLIEFVPRQKVIELLSSGLQSQHIDIAMRAAQLLTGQPEDREPEVLQKKLQMLISVLKGQVGETKASRKQRAAALSLLRGLGSKAAPAVPALVELLERDDPDLKPVEPTNIARDGRTPEFNSDWIISTLGGIGPAASAALPELEARLKLVEQQEREEALLSPESRNRRFDTTSSSGLRRVIDRIKSDRER